MEEWFIYIHSVCVWSNISKSDAIPKEKKPKGIKDEWIMCWNLFKDIKPKNIGITIAWKWANKRKKEKDTV